MLPDFPQQKRRMKDLFELKARVAHVGNAPLLSMAHVIIPHEGDRFSFQREDGEIIQGRPQEFRASVSFGVDDPKQLPFHKVIDRADELGKEMARQEMGAYYGKVIQEAEEAGTQLDAGGRPFHPDMILDMLEKMRIEFDEEGNPQLPALVVGPQLFEHIEKRFGQSGPSPAWKARKEKIIANKKEEWRAREARRRLVD